MKTLVSSIIFEEVKRRQYAVESVRPATFLGGVGATSLRIGFWYLGNQRLCVVRVKSAILVE